MRVFEDPFYQGLIGDHSPFGSVFAMDAAEKIIANIGTKYERVRYTEDERRWAFRVLRKPFRYD